MISSLSNSNQDIVRKPPNFFNEAWGKVKKSSIPSYYLSSF